MKKETHNWRLVKSKIVLAYGTVSAAAAAIGSSTEGIRQAVRGRCPGVARKLKQAGLLAA